MRSYAVIVLLSFVAQTSGEESKDTLVDRLLDQMLKVAVPRQSLTGLTSSERLPSASIFNSRPGANPGLPRSQSSVATKAHFTDKEVKFYYGDVDFPYKEVKSSEVAQMMEDGWLLLDVRDPQELERAAVKGAIEVPSYLRKNDFASLYGIYQEMVCFGLGGWWSGLRPMKENYDFIRQVEEKIPKNARILVLCHTGLRSKLMMKQLYLAGYKDMAWVQGGFSQFKKGEIQTVKDGVNVRMAASGSLAGAMGWHVGR